MSKLQDLIDDYESGIGPLPNVFTIPDDELITLLEKAIDEQVEMEGLLTPLNVDVVI